MMGYEEFRLMEVKEMRDGKRTAGTKSALREWKKEKKEKKETDERWGWDGKQIWATESKNCFLRFFCR